MIFGVIYRGDFFIVCSLFFLNKCLENLKFVKVKLICVNLIIYLIFNFMNFI